MTCPDYSDIEPGCYFVPNGPAATTAATPVPVTVKFKKLRPDARVPMYATEGAAGADIRSITGYRLRPGGRQLVATGIAIEVPEGYEARVRPRSGLALKHGITVLNATGTIDADYRGEVGVILFNAGPVDYIISAGDAIAQLVIAPVVQAAFSEVSELSDSTRATAGYGSTTWRKK